MPFFSERKRRNVMRELNPGYAALERKYRPDA